MAWRLEDARGRGTRCGCFGKGCPRPHPTASSSLLWSTKWQPNLGLEHSPGYIFMERCSATLRRPISSIRSTSIRSRVCLRRSSTSSKFAGTGDQVVSLCDRRANGESESLQRRGTSRPARARLDMLAADDARRRDRRRVLLGWRFRGKSRDLSADLRVRSSPTSSWSTSRRPNGRTFRSPLPRS